MYEYNLRNTQIRASNEKRSHNNICRNYALGCTKANTKHKSGGAEEITGSSTGHDWGSSTGHDWGSSTGHDWGSSTGHDWGSSTGHD